MCCWVASGSAYLPDRVKNPPFDQAHISSNGGCRCSELSDLIGHQFLNAPLVYNFSLTGPSFGWYW